MVAKRIFALIITVLMLAAFAVPAFADVIIEPENNGFYQKHSDDCDHDDAKAYTARAEAGVNMYDEPNGKVVYVKDAGEIFYSQWYYIAEDGVEWRCHMFYNGSSFDSYWFNINDVLRLYDYNDFEAEHKKEFYDASEIECDISKAVFYEYPCGPVKYSAAELHEFEPCFQQYFKDEASREWGYIGYSYGIRNVWVCLSDPENAALSEGEQRLLDPVSGAEAGTMPFAEPAAAQNGDAPLGGSLQDDPNTDPENTERPSAPRETIDPNAQTDKIDPSRDGGQNSKLGLIIGIVAGAAAVCAAVLAILFKKKKNIG